MSTQENPNLAQENARLRAKLSQVESVQLHAAHVAFCESLPGIAPVWREVAVANLDHLASLPVAVEFGEGDGRGLLLDGMKEMLLSLPPVVQFGEYATNERAAPGSLKDAEMFVPKGTTMDPESMALHRKAVMHQKAYGGTYEDAVSAVA